MKYTWRLILVLTGLMILVLSAPHDSPWAMKYIKSSFGGSTMINVSFFGGEIAFSASTLWKSLAPTLVSYQLYENLYDIPPMIHCQYIPYLYSLPYGSGTNLIIR